MRYCPKCGADIKGDECEKCGSPLTIDEVLNTTCAICGNPCSKKTNKNLYFKLSEFEKEIETQKRKATGNTPVAIQTLYFPTAALSASGYRSKS